MNKKLKTLGTAALIAAAAIALPGIAGTVTGLTTFTANTPARASEVNGNFTAVKTAVDDNQAQITALNARITALEAQLTNVVALNAYLSLQTVNGHPTVRVSAANLQVVNGEGSTDQTNGLGNLIVGYDEARPDTASPTCSRAVANSIQSQTACSDGGGVWARNHKSGSHNLVLGTKNNYSSYGGAIFGSGNALTDAYASVTGGQNNVAGGPLSSVTGGSTNSAWGFYSSVTGGSLNQSTGEGASVSGGSRGQATALAAAIAGGGSNLASGDFSSIAGGFGNQTPGNASAVSGGFGNVASGTASTVGGGQSRQATTGNSWAAGTFSAVN
jgi:hypothetical protein